MPVIDLADRVAALPNNHSASRNNGLSPSCDQPQPIPALAPSINPVIPSSIDPLPLSALAAILGCTRSTIRHFADRLGFRYTVRPIGPRHKRTACLTPGQANAIAAEVEREAAAYDATSSSSSSSSSETGLPRHGEATAGLFYRLQLEPQHDPGRFKLGFSKDLASRLDNLLTVVPLARLIAAWPAHRSWERIAIIATAQDAEQISQEVFRSENLEEVVAAAHRFFAVMPKLAEPPPRDISPPHPEDRWFPTTADPHVPQPAISPPLDATSAEIPTAPPAQIPTTAPPGRGACQPPPSTPSPPRIPIPVTASNTPPLDSWETHAIPR